MENKQLVKCELCGKNVFIDTTIPMIHNENKTVIYICINIDICDMEEEDVV